MQEYIHICIYAYIQYTYTIYDICNVTCIYDVIYMNVNVIDQPSYELSLDLKFEATHSQHCSTDCSLSTCQSFIVPKPSPSWLCYCYAFVDINIAIATDVVSLPCCEVLLIAFRLLVLLLAVACLAQPFASCLAPKPPPLPPNMDCV